MKRIISILILHIMFVLALSAQREEASISIGINYLIAIQNVGANANYPELYMISLGYEHAIAEVWGLEAGISVGQYSQKIGYEEYQHTFYSSKGTVVSPFVSPKYYVPLGNESNSLFLENTFSYSFLHLSKNDRGLTTQKYQFVYQIGLGYWHKFSDLFSACGSINYSTFDFFRGNDNIDAKTATPLCIKVTAKLNL